MYRIRFIFMYLLLVLKLKLQTFLLYSTNICSRLIVNFKIYANNKNYFTSDIKLSCNEQNFKDY